jgi:hypothetical protein
MQKNIPVIISFMINFTSILVGFFLAINVSTILGQTGDWGILASGILTGFLECTNNILYSNKKKCFNRIISP